MHASLVFVVVRTCEDLAAWMGGMVRVAVIFFGVFVDEVLVIDGMCVILTLVYRPSPVFKYFLKQAHL